MRKFCAKIGYLIEIHRCFEMSFGVAQVSEMFSNLCGFLNVSVLMYILILFFHVHAGRALSYITALPGGEQKCNSI
jgi:hypothetical protein